MRNVWSMQRAFGCLRSFLRCLLCFITVLRDSAEVAKAFSDRSTSLLDELKRLADLSKAGRTYKLPQPPAVFVGYEEQLNAVSHALLKGVCIGAG